MDGSVSRDANKDLAALNRKLVYTAEYGHPDIAILLLNNGADLDARDYNGFTPRVEQTRG